MTHTATQNVEETLQALANLQFIDSRIDEIERLRGDLPDEIYDIESQAQYLEARIEKIRKDQHDLGLEDQFLLSEMDESQNFGRKYEAQQMTVRNNREYDALTKEIEAQKNRYENAVSRRQELVEVRQKLADDLADSEAKLDEIVITLADKRKHLEVVIEKTSAEEKILVGLRNEASKLVSERYLKNYERLRKGLGNRIAVAPMERGACQGVLLTPQIQVEVKRKSRIVIDENSGRIVVDPSFFEFAKKSYSTQTH